MRTQPDCEQEVTRALEDLTDTLVGGSSGLSGATLYGRSAVPSDLSLHLEWDTLSVPDQGSEIALSIVREFRPFGLLDHLLLIEKRRYSRPMAGLEVGEDAHGGRKATHRSGTGRARTERAWKTQPSGPLKRKEVDHEGEKRENH